MIKLDADSFNFYFPFDILKSNPDNEWRIGGYASTASEDRDGDEIVQKGLDISDFINYGWLNFDHQKDIIVGYPDKNACKVDSKGFYVEGTLLKSVSQAKNMWEAAVALQKSGSGRRLGFSVEGKVLKRNDDGKIVKAKIYNVAVTPNPVNTDCTWDIIVKSFAPDIEKGLEAGHGDANGSPIIPEALESAFKTLSYAVGDDEEAKTHMNKLIAKLSHKQDITKSEKLLYLRLVKGLSREDAMKAYQLVETHQEEE